MDGPPELDILQDDLSRFQDRGPAFVTFGEVMIREMPADGERPERTRLVHLSPAGAEFNVAVALARLGIPASYISRLPDNPYGRGLQDVAREHGVGTDHLVWAPETEPLGRFIYEMGRAPRKTRVFYQRMYSAASRLGTGMVDWAAALADARLFHITGITLGLSTHSGYEVNHCHEALVEAMGHKPAACLVGLDFNYRSTLWGMAEARAAITPVLERYVDVLITTLEDMARFYDIGCGPYSAKAIAAGERGRVSDDDLRATGQHIIERFGLEIVALTMRHSLSFDEHEWESVAADAQGHFCRSPCPRAFRLLDRLGGGDAWTAGFYYGLLTAGDAATRLAKGVLVGDALTRLKQTLLFDLPVVDREEIQALMHDDALGGQSQVIR